MFLSEFVNGVQQIGAGALLIIFNNHIQSLIWGNDSIYLFHSHSKDENGNLSSFGTAVLLKFDPSYSLENCVRPVYYNTFPLTLYFQAQFIKVHGTAIAKNTIKSELKKESLSSRREKDLLAKKENIRATQKRRKKIFKNRYYDKRKSIRQYPKEKYLMNRTS